MNNENVESDKKLLTEFFGKTKINIKKICENKNENGKKYKEILTEMYKICDECIDFENKTMEDKIKIIDELKKSGNMN